MYANYKLMDLLIVEKLESNLNSTGQINQPNEPQRP